MQLQQSGGRSSILSHVETQDYQLVPSEGGRQFNLLRSITARQLVSAAGRSLLVERTYDFSGYQINSRDLRELACRGDGLRPADVPRHGRGPAHPAPRGGHPGGRAAEEPRPLAARRRDVRGRPTTSRSRWPGFSLVDYDFRKTRGGAVAVLRGPDPRHEPDQARRRAVPLSGWTWRSPRSPRRAASSRAATRWSVEGLWTFEETVGVLASWQARPGVSLGGSSYLSLNLFRPTGDTDPAFQASGRASRPDVRGAQAHAQRLHADGHGPRGDRLGWPRARLSRRHPVAARHLFPEVLGRGVRSSSISGSSPRPA